MSTKKIERLGILTGGGDCPGLNAVIRAVTKAAIYKHQIRVFGIEDGFQGLVENRVGELSSLHVSGILTRGGTILGTNNRANPSKYYTGDDANGKPVFIDAVEHCLMTVRTNQLDALVVIGGDGTMSCAAPLVERGVNCIGVPKTIDNDIVGSDITFGFQTAVRTASQALDRLHSTAASHHRVMVCELMGRNAGWLTLNAGIASGSDVILIPEIPYDIDKICKFVSSRMDRQRGFSIIACSEGVKSMTGEQIVSRNDPSSPDPIRLGGIAQHIASEIEERTGIESRYTVLGHVQRGGEPTAFDRVLATQFGYHALELIVAGKTGRMVVTQAGQITDIDLLDCANKQRLVPIDHPLIEVARSVRSSFGD